MTDHKKYSVYLVIRAAGLRTKQFYFKTLSDQTEEGLHLETVVLLLVSVALDCL